MSRRTWDAMDDDVLRTLHANGRGVTWIACFMCVAKSTVHRRARYLGIVFGLRHRWTPAEDAMLRRRYPDELAATVAKNMGLRVGQVHQRAAKFGLHKSDAFKTSDLSARIQRGKQSPNMIAHRFSKGHVPANKGLRRPGWAPGRMAETQFKKGRPAREARNYVPIGTEKFDAKRGVIVRKITDDSFIVPAQRWRPVHTLVWERTHGPVPAGHIVVFKPGRRTTDTAAITPDHVELVTLAENMRRNSYHNRYPKEVGRLIQLKGALNRKINRRQHEKQDS